MLISRFEGLLAYRTLPFGKALNKKAHMAFQSAGAFCACVGLIAVFLSHNDVAHGGVKPNLYTAHGWIGILVVTLYFAQCVARRRSSSSSSLSSVVCRRWWRRWWRVRQRALPAPALPLRPACTLSSPLFPTSARSHSRKRRPTLDRGISRGASSSSSPPPPLSLVAAGARDLLCAPGGTRSARSRTGCSSAA